MQALLIKLVKYSKYIRSWAGPHLRFVLYKKLASLIFELYEMAFKEFFYGPDGS